MVTPSARGIEGRERRVVLPRGLADRRAHHDLEDLVLAEARCPRRGDVLVGDLVGVLGDLVDQRAQRLGKPCVVERGAALGVRSTSPSRIRATSALRACVISDMPIAPSYATKRTGLS
jgi:hypothetical protein